MNESKWEEGEVEEGTCNLEGLLEKWASKEERGGF
jgi:hypothetical protein